MLILECVCENNQLQISFILYLSLPNLHQHFLLQYPLVSVLTVGDVKGFVIPVTSHLIFRGWESLQFYESRMNFVKCSFYTSQANRLSNGLLQMQDTLLLAWMLCFLFNFTFCSNGCVLQCFCKLSAVLTIY